MVAPVDIVIPLCVAILYGVTKFEVAKDADSCIVFDEGRRSALRL